MQHKKWPQAARAVLVDLIVKCPHGDETENSPFRNIRQSSFAEQFNWVKALPENELLDLFSAHCDCLGDIKQY